MNAEVDKNSSKSSGSKDSSIEKTKIKKGENENTDDSTNKEKRSVQDSEINEVIEELPPEHRKTFRALIHSSSMMNKPTHPLFDKFNENHIDKFLDYTQRDDDNLFKLKSSNRWFVLVYTLLVIAVFLFLVVFLLPTDKEMFLDLVKILVAFGGGVGSGYGLKSYLDRK
ncbi:MAG TPA: hypothetical protein ENN33_10705 [Ignavibacteria bacterium]|nr:hypothetical protein [Ignavibacteria bacterium]